MLFIPAAVSHDARRFRGISSAAFAAQRLPSFRGSFGNDAYRKGKLSRRGFSAYSNRRVGAAARGAAGPWPGGASTGRRLGAPGPGRVGRRACCAACTTTSSLTMYSEKCPSGIPKIRKFPPRKTSPASRSTTGPLEGCSIRGPPEQPAQVVDHSQFIFCGHSFVPWRRRGVLLLAVL